MSEQGKGEEAGNEQDSAISQQENCILSSEVDEKEENGKSDQVRKWSNFSVKSGI